MCPAGEATAGLLRVRITRAPGRYDRQKRVTRELGEEAQLTVAPGELKTLFDKPLFSGTSTSNEALYFFYLERRMPLAEILSLNSRKTGAEGENEHTELRVVSMPEAHRLIRNIHGIMSHLLYLNDVGDYETMRLL